MKSSILSAVGVALSLVLAVTAAPVNGTTARVRRRCTPKPSSSSSSTPTSTPTSDPTTDPAPTPTAPSGSGGGGMANGPIFSVYADQGFDADSWPSASSLGDWNDLVLAFWLSKDNDMKPYDIATVWTQLDSGKRQQILDEYHQAGKMIRVSLFGSTDMPLKYNGDPTAIGKAAAAFVKEYNLDGVDVDYEDSDSFNGNGDGENFLITLTNVLRDELPAPLVISHAPQTPYFMTEGSWYPQGAYLKIHKEVGDKIDFYNIQTYNQGDGFSDCDGLFNKGPWPGTSINEIIASGIPAEKVIVGKLGEADDGGDGYMAPADIGSCIKSQSQKPGGVMAWEWIHAGPDWISAAKGDL